MKKWLAVLLLMMVLCMTVPAFAAEKTYSGVCTPITVNADGEHTVILNGVTIEATDSPAISVEAPADKLTVILKDGTVNHLTGGSLSAGIANNGVTLVIRCEKAGKGHVCGENCGVLYAVGGGDLECDGGAGIGGNAYCDLEGTVIIEGGNIYANNDYYGAGIGGGAGGSLKGSLIITGGRIEAQGSMLEGGAGESSFVVLTKSAAIGGGSGGDLSGSVTITGGYVAAQGGNFSAGIGGSDDGEMSGIVTITGGEVKAWGNSDLASAIGVCTQRADRVTGKIIVHPAVGRIEGDAQDHEQDYEDEETYALIGSAFTRYTDVTDQMEDKKYVHFIHIAPPATPVPSPVPEIPATGDSMNFALLAVLAAAGMIGMTVLLRRKKA